MSTAGAETIAPLQENTHKQLLPSVPFIWQCNKLMVLSVMQAVELMPNRATGKERGPGGRCCCPTTAFLPWPLQKQQEQQD